MILSASPATAAITEISFPTPPTTSITTTTTTTTTTTNPCPPDTHPAPASSRRIAAAGTRRRVNIEGAGAVAVEGAAALNHPVKCGADSAVLREYTCG